MGWHGPDLYRLGGGKLSAARWRRAGAGLWAEAHLETTRNKKGGGLNHCVQDLILGSHGGSIRDVTTGLLAWLVSRRGHLMF
jgi:hypothetical protein